MSPTQMSADLAAESLLQAVAERVGNDDFGSGPFVDALRLLLTAGAGETLNEAGRRVLRSIAVRHLRNRLAIQAFIRSHPHADTTAIVRPIVVTGLPRTATTALQQLLALDPRHRPLRLWEALRPVPAADAADRSARVDEAEEWLTRFYGAVPGFQTIHPLRADGPEECDALLQNSFASRHFDDMFDAPAYSEWFASAPLTGEYAHYAMQLRVLASGDDVATRWVLKTPSHLGHLDALLQVFPDALVVHCHRDPLQAVSSYASLIATLRSAYSAAVDRRVVGAEALQRCATEMTRALAVREVASPGQFVDIAHDQVVNDPIAAVRAVYAAAGETLDEIVEACMRDWLQHNRKGSHGEHRYGPDQFGIDPDEVSASFAAYRDRFGGVLRWR